MRFNLETLCDCASLYTLQQLYQVKSVVEIFENTGKHEVLDCSYPPPGWEEFVRQVNEKIVK